MICKRMVGRSGMKEVDEIQIKEEKEITFIYISCGKN